MRRDRTIFLPLAASFAVFLIPAGALGAAAFQGMTPASHAEASRLAGAAQAALRQGDYAAAIGDLEKLVKMAPGVAESHANLGMAYYWANRSSEAAGEFERALKLNPGLTNARCFLGLALAKGGRCKEAVGELSQDYALAPDAALRREIGVEGVDCSMALNDGDRAADFARRLERDFSDDPEILYLSSHLYSDLSTQAAERLLNTAPSSYQAHQMNAEVLNQQGKFDDAAAEYRRIIEMNPKLPGMHYRLGRVLLEGPKSAQTEQTARQEFEAELKLNPEDALSEYELGELARKARQWNEAIEHFGRAARFDPTLTDALVGLGKALLSAGRVEEAVAPLQDAARLAPEDMVAHYQLALAYRRLGRQEDSDREQALYDKLHDQQALVQQTLAGGISGRVSNGQTAEPPGK